MDNIKGCRERHHQLWTPRGLDSHWKSRNCEASGCWCVSSQESQPGWWSDKGDSFNQLNDVLLPTLFDNKWCKHFLTLKCQCSLSSVTLMIHINDHWDFPRQAIWLLCTGAREAAFRNIKSIAECLSDELINAAKVHILTSIWVVMLALKILSIVGIFQQLRNQEEGWVGACGQVQQINIGPRGSQSWRRNERPSFLPTSAQTWKYLLVHAKLLYLGNHSCILAEILVDLRQWGPSGERRGWGGWRGRGGRWGQGSGMWNNVMYTRVLKMMLNLPTLYEKTW